MNDFNADLKYGELASHETFWEDIYKIAFPDMAFSVLSTAGKSQSQNLGIDRIIHLKSGKTLYIDEKKRRTKYNDILLEYRSNDKKNTAGWMFKQLHIDYLSYAFMPTREVYLFDWQTLRRVWLDNGKQWKEKYGLRVAKNKGYNTLSVPVPITVLLEKMNNALVIKL